MWISPVGEIVEKNDRSRLTRIIENPEMFGFTEKQIDDIYAKYEEEKYCEHRSVEKGKVYEGKAGEDIIVKLIENGWIYIFYSETTCVFFIELYKLNDESKAILQKWANELIMANQHWKSSTVNITDFYFEPDKQDYTGEETHDEALYNKKEWERIHKTPLIWINSAIEFMQCAPMVRYRAIKQRVVGQEIKIGRRLTKKEIDELADEIKFAPAYTCSVEDIANGNFVISPDKIKLDATSLKICVEREKKE
jgi:hypothetical protein